ncbi:MAG TPA: sulfur oxidation c-type cytochrome SoxX [Persephonella sp.]|nr:sulfur oxidation c-type cytochrome SoxX [Hydrogenothermaceae bacterium]HIQ25273.1 sulfur oxidation c-type cytochrome SoxX [Persephonella sp.]
MKLKLFTASVVLLGGFSLAIAGNCPGVESPDGKKVLKKDMNPHPRLYAIPSNCKLDNPKFVAKMAEKGKKLFNNKKIANCVACHNAPGSVGAGNIGPDLTGYMSTLFKAPDARGQKKSIDWIYQRVADYRVQIPEEMRNPKSPKFVPYYNIMTVNLTTGKLSYDDVCAITAFLMTLK